MPSRLSEHRQIAGTLIEWLLLALHKYLLLLLDLLNDTNVDLQNIGNSVSRGQSKPLRKRDISNTVTLVKLNPNKLFGFRSVLNVVTCDS